MVTVSVRIEPEEAGASLRIAECADKSIGVFTGRVDIVSTGGMDEIGFSTAGQRGAGPSDIGGIVSICLCMRR